MLLKTFLTFLSVGILTVCYGQRNLDGIYDGLEEMCSTLKNGKKDCYTDPDNPKWKWYHLTYIKIKGDSAYADQSPISIYKKDTTYSASDGGFYYYKGTITQADSIVIIRMKFIIYDYCAVPKKNSSGTDLFPWTKTYTCKITQAGLLINGFAFRRSEREDKLISERHK